MARDRLLGRIAAILAGVLAVAVAFGGCSSDDNIAGPGEDDEEVLRSILMDSTSEFADWFNLDSFFGEGQEGLLSPGLPALLSPAGVGDSIRWYRDPLRPFDYQITVTVDDDSAFVESQVTINGTFHVWKRVTAVQETTVHYMKDLHDVAVQRVAFIRYPDSLGAFRRGWRLEYVSDVESRSPDGGPTITSVVLSSPATEQEWVITDPLELHRRRDVPILPRDADVEVTVNFTGDPTLAFLHTGEGLNRRRFEIDELEPGVAHGTWHTHWQPGVHHAAVDLLHENTIMDAVYPYESNAWLIVYRVGGEITPD